LLEYDKATLIFIPPRPETDVTGYEYAASPEYIFTPPDGDISRLKGFTDSEEV
jgi:hypothetical protein